VEKENPGQVSLWAERLHMQNEWTLSRYLGKLILTAMAYNRQQSPNKIREKIESGELIPQPEIQTCLKVGIKHKSEGSYRSHSKIFFRIRSKRKTARSRELDLEKVVKFLENQLEVDHDH
jgi:hypothetical protein